MVETIREGYKQTEVGVIPEDWDVKRLGEVFRLRGGFAFSSDYFSNNGPIVITPGNFKLDGGLYFNERNTKRFSGGYRSHMVFEKGDLLVVMTDLTPDCKLLGKPAFVESDEIILHNQRIGKVETTTKNIVLDFLYFYFFSEGYSQKLKETATGSTVRHTSNSSIYSCAIALPPTIEEQSAIASALSDVDAVITKYEDLISKKRDVKQGAMQELLTGKRRLNGFDKSGGEFKQTEVGVIPKDWDVKSLGELFEITSSKRVFQSEWKTEGIPFYRARELAVLSQNGYVNNELFISEDMYSGFIRNYGVPQIGDMLVTGVGTLGKVYVVSDSHKFYFKDGNIIWFKISGKINSSYLKQLYLTRLITKQIKDSSAGTTVGTYTITGATKTTIPLPTIEEQTAIAQILSDMDAEIEVLEEKLDKYRAVKQGMMQELLTGKTRLVNV